MKKYKLSYDEISMLCLELSLFIHAGADSAGALMLLSEEVERESLRDMLKDMVRGLDEGKSLARAFEDSGAFPREVSAQLTVAERTGRCEETLSALAEYYDRCAAMDRQVRAALLSPSVLLIIMLAVIVVLLTKVLPIFSDVYASLGAQLTGAAGVLLRLGEAMRPALPVICILLALMAVFVGLFAASEGFRQKVSAVWKKLSRGRGVYGKADTARFARAMHMALASGLTAEEAVASAGDVFDKASPAAARCRDCVEKISVGESAVSAMRTAGLLPPTECSLLELGFKSGSGETAMEEVARRLERESEEAVEKAVGSVEPVMVAVASLLVGAILLSVMLPLANIMSAIG